VDWNDSEIRGFRGDALDWSLKWAEVRRVAWVTEDWGIGCPEDRFLAVQVPNGVTLISDEIAEAQELDNEVARRFPPTLGPDGRLEGVTANATVIVWPAGEAGQELWMRTEPEYEKGRVPLRYVLRSR